MWFIIRLGVAHSTMMYIIRNNNTNPMFVVWLLAFSWAFVCAPCISWYGNLFILLITADVLVEFPRVPEQWMYYPCSCNSSRLSRYNIVFFPWHTCHSFVPPFIYICATTVFVRNTSKTRLEEMTKITHRIRIPQTIGIARWQWHTVTTHPSIHPRRKRL